MDRIQGSAEGMHRRTNPALKRRAKFKRRYASTTTATSAIHGDRGVMAAVLLN